MPNQPYATVEQLTERLGMTPPNAARLLDDASADVDRVVSAPFTVDRATGLPATPAVAAVLAEACVKQVEYMLEVGEAVGIVGPPRNGSESTGRQSSNWQPGRIGPRALDVLARYGFLVVR